MNLIQALKLKKHVIWDFNGTLVDDVDLCVQIINRFLQSKGRALIHREYYRQVFEFPVSNFYKNLGFQLSQEDYREIGHSFCMDFKAGLSEIDLHHMIPETLGYLKNENIGQSILSATNQTDLIEHLSHFRIEHYFDRVFGIENRIADSKLKRGHELFDLLQLDPSDVILVGDTLHDLEVGKSIGIEVLLVGHGHQCDKKLKNHHHQVIPATKFFSSGA